MASKSCVLAFDTSGPHCAAALTLGKEVIATHTEERKKGQAEHLFPILEQLLSDAKCSWSDLDRIAVGTGPGNFTGIRISVAAARGLGISLNIPAVGISNLSVAAAETSGPGLATVCAPRDQVYIQRCFGGATYDDASLISAADLDRAQPIYPLEDLSLEKRIARIAHIALRSDAPTTAPVPTYVRPADAAIPQERPPRIKARREC